MTIESEVGAVATGQWWEAVPLWVYLVAALGLVVLVEAWMVEHYKVKGEKYAAAVSEYVGAQKTNLQTIATLQNANAEQAKAAQAQQAAGASASKISDDFSTVQQLQPSKAATQLKVIYAHDPTARTRAAAVLPVAVNDLLHANAGG